MSRLLKVDNSAIPFFLLIQIPHKIVHRVEVFRNVLIFLLQINDSIPSATCRAQNTITHDRRYRKKEN